MQNNYVFKHLLALLLVASVLTSGCATTRESKSQQQKATTADHRSSPTTPGISSNRQSGFKSNKSKAAQPSNDVWDRIRAGYGLPDVRSPYIADYEKWYSSRPEYIERMVKRASPYLYYITNQVEARGMPMEIALLPAIESAYKPHALSRSKAAGIWQFIPSTGRHYGLKQNYWYDGRKDIVAATNAALNYLEKLNKDFKGDWALTLAAYNAGEGRVGREIKKNARRGKPINYTALTGLRLETRRYVPKLIAISNMIKNPQKYGLQVAVVPNQPYFSEIRLGSQIDLNIVADSSGVPIKELKMLNPGFKRWATDPAGPHRLLVPVDEAVVVADAIARIPQSQRMRWDYYTVRKGDSLNRIARKHHVSTASLRKSNKINGNLIHPGQNLLIPVSTSSNKARQYERTASKTTTRKTGTAANAASKPVTVSVRKGDTLWSLSRRYNVSLNELARWNQIDVNDLLHMGQKLKIWR